MVLYRGLWSGEKIQKTMILAFEVTMSALGHKFIIAPFFNFESTVPSHGAARKVVGPEAYFSLLCNEMIIDGSMLCCCCTTNTYYCPWSNSKDPLGSFLSPCLLPPLTFWSWANYKTCTSSLIFFKGIRNGALVLLTNHKMVGAQPYFPPYHNGQKCKKWAI